MLFKEIVYGPIRSRRLGISLGMNLMPTEQKVCTFDCVYCECGWNGATRAEGDGARIPTRESVKLALREKLEALKVENIHPDVITFSGNGEPTLHPDFEGIIHDTCLLRDEFCPEAQVSVLSNSTQLHRDDVVRGLQMADKRIMKLDSAFDATMHLIDQPVNERFTVDRVIADLKKFEGRLTVQTCFLRGEHNGKRIDNTTEKEVSAWLDALGQIRPEDVMIYVIDRATPEEKLEKISKEEMDAIANRVRRMGLPVQVSA